VRPAAVVLAAGLAAAAACAGAPKYVPPALEPPAAYKELGPWQDARPADEALRGAWWEVFADADLNALETQVTVSNQTLRAAQAQFLQARALVRGAKAAELPTVTAAASATAADQSENKPLRSKTAETRYNDYILRGDVSYEFDLWGRVASTVAAARATAQASAADLEVVNLAVHAELALDYFQVRALDTERQILESSVAALERALELTRNRYKGGAASGVDVAQAETQLETTRAQAIDVQVRRAQFEHAIAALTGGPAPVFSLPPGTLAATVPDVPPGLPASVLERRPDVAAAERRVAAANAQIGVAKAAFFPAVTLTGSAGLESGTIGDWLKLASNFWAVAPAAAITVFDGGRRRAVNEQAAAAYQRADALYRDAVLTAFKEVEDNLAALRILALEARTQDAAVAAARRLLTLATNRYQGGVTTYLEVVVAQNATLNAERTALAIRSRRLAATILLIKALGGGWDASRLPVLRPS
jgi:NodT family efflux transporter outer membrane factor (OMF) lipoprotein